MYDYFEIAYALANQSLCLFLGTGFSKHITDGNAPTWVELLKDCCDELKNPNFLKGELFPDDENILPLEECAQIIELELKKEGKNLREIIAKIIDDLEVDEDKSQKVREFFDEYENIKIITTNYDMLIENSIAPGECNSYCPGKHIPKRKRSIEVYHIHGSTDSPNDMIITANDYYNFINTPSYFQNKIYSLIQENTTVIIGYSLGDPNLKPIFNYHSNNNLSSLNRNSLFYVTRSSTPRYMKDYYESSYSIKVVKVRGIDSFLRSVNRQYGEANKNIERRQATLKRVLAQNKNYKKTFLRLRHSFFHIISAASAIGADINSRKMKELINRILKRKFELTSESQAWDQYDHLAEWLVYLGSKIDIKGTLLEETYLKAVNRSMRTMSKEHYIGYSWEAYQTWRWHWESLTASNRDMITKYVEEEHVSRDAQRITIEGKNAY